MKQQRTDILLVRHGRTAWNVEGRVQGQSDVGLDAVGLKEATAMAKYLERCVRCAALYASDLRRSVETANEIAAATSLQVIVEPKLREIDAGRWEGELFAEIEAAERAAMAAAPDEYRFPGGETWREVHRRTAEALEEIARRHIGSRVLVVTHGGPIRAVLSSWGSGKIQDKPVPNGSITEICWCEGARRPLIGSVGIVPSVGVCAVGSRP